MIDTFQRLDIIVDGVAITKLFAFSPTNLAIGTVDLRHHKLKVASIRQLYVHAAYRMQGLGRKLIDECCEIARKSKCKSIGLLVNRNNADAQCFYLRLGFIFAYSDTEDYIMCKSLQYSQVTPAARAALDAYERHDSSLPARMDALREGLNRQRETL